MMRIPVLFSILFILVLKAESQVIPADSFYQEPFNPASGAWTALPKSDDGYQQVNLPFSVSFCGIDYTSLYIQTNGEITLGYSSNSYLPQIFPLNSSTPAIAPFWSDVDTQGSLPASKPYANKVWYRIYADRLVVIWDSVGKYFARIDSLNKFELRLADNSKPLHRTSQDYDFRFTYDTLSWVVGAASGGNFPVAGWTDGSFYFSSSPKYYNLPGSGTSRLTGWPGHFSRAFQFNILEAQALNTLPAAPVIDYPDVVYYTAGTTITPVTPANTGGAVPATIYGSVSTYAGSSAGYTDSVTRLNAKFKKPTGLATDRLGNVYVGDCGNGRVRKINTAGYVTTYSKITGDTAVVALATDLTGKVYKAINNSNKVVKMDSAGRERFNYGSIAGYTYNKPSGVAVDDSGNVYVADQVNNRIRFSTASGNLTTVNLGFMNPNRAGTGSAGMVNGDTAFATFNKPTGIARDTSGNLYVADMGNNQVRKITKAGVVSLFAGSASGTAGFANGTGSAASFNKPFALTTDRIGNVYVADTGNNIIRKITPAGVVTTLAGSGVAGLKDTTVGLAATFNGLGGIDIDQQGNLYVSDANNNRVRKIVTTGYTITPALPTGLRFDSTTGAISGKLAVVLAPATYTVTAYNTGGSSSASFVLSNPPVSLAIKLANIRAVNKDAVNEVQWKSGSEEAGDAYEVQRSVDASAFIALGTVPGHAVNGGQYIYTDQSPVTGANYYRLKLLNIDGSSSYSGIVSAVKKDNFGLTVFPNPVKSTVIIQVNGKVAGTGMITLYDIPGRQRRSARLNGQQASLSMNGLPNGVYVVRYQDAEHSEIFRIVKE
jgi:hypothetical protein